MNLDFDTGTKIVIASMVFFYVRIAWLRGRKIRRNREDIIKMRRSNRSNDIPEHLQPRYLITRWFLCIPGILLMLVGLAIKTSTWFPTEWDPYWYVPLASGVVMLAMSINTRQ